MNKEQEIQLLDLLAKMRALIYHEQGAKIIESIKDKDVIIFIGNTRAGKSTIVNYVIGNPLRAVRVNKRVFKILVDGDQSKGPKIGEGSTSKTTVPTAWISTKVNGLVVDAPGFDDNRGEAQDVANAFYIKELISNAKSVKFVLLSDINDILTDNISHFTNFIDKIHTMLPSGNRLHHGMVVLFNKDRDDTSKEEIAQYLREKILNEINIKIQNRDLVKYFVDNKNKIVVVGMPTQDGIITDAAGVFGDLMNVIEAQTTKLSKELLSDVTPGISDRSRIFLLEARRYFTESHDLDGILDEVRQQFNVSLHDYEITSATPQEARTDKKNRLTELLNKVKALTEPKPPLEELLLRIGAIVPAVKGLQKDSDIFMKLKFVIFVDQILRIDASDIFMIKINATLSVMKDKIFQTRISAQEQMLEISVAEANNRYQTLQAQREKDLNQFQTQLQELQRKQLELLEAQKKESRSRGCTIL